AGSPDWNSLRVKWGLDIFESFYTQPRTVDEAKQQGYRLIGPDKCGASKTYNGLAYVKGDDPTVTLLFDINGYIAGIQTAIRLSDEQRTGFPPKSLRPPFVLDGKDNNRYVLTVYFTDPSKICTEGRSKEQFEEEGTGENLWIQTGSSPSEVMKVAKNQDEISAPWVEGKCFTTMGHHYWYNTTADMDCDELLPVFLLYNGGRLNGFGFVSLADMESKYYEHPEYGIFKIFMKEVPKCLQSKGRISTTHDRLAVQLKGGLSVDSLSVEMDTGGLRNRESETVLGAPLLNIIYTQLNGALKMLQQVSGLKHMDQSVIHHPLKGLTQAARERNRPIVGRIRRILTGFGIGTTEASLQDGGMSLVVQMLLKSLRRVCRQDSGRCLRN
ncbi:hypothetical protein PoB_001594400, partial [Plakobranchus ocellatus]